VSDRVPPVFAPPGQGGAGQGDEGGAARGPSWPPEVYEDRRAGGSVSERLREHMEAFPDFPRAGIVFQDLMPVLKAPELFAEVVEQFATEALRVEADTIAAVESRGFLFAAPLSIRLGCPLLPIRKQGKLPGRTLQERYALEYGEAELEIQTGAIRAGSRVFVVDDLLATGGTLEAACRLVERADGKIAGLGVVVELVALEGAARLAPHELLALVRM